MKVFILEDDPERIEWFRGRLLRHELTFADSCSQVSKFKPPYDLILFDHDLGGRQMTQHEDNGANFARAIKDKIDAPVVVHSYNKYGAEAILNELRLPREAFKPFRGLDFCAALDLWEQNAERARKDTGPFESGRSGHHGALPSD